MVSNTLGTSMGDFLSDSSGLGYAAARSSSPASSLCCWL
jgi:uncharacterized membrane-anchored protein